MMVLFARTSPRRPRRAAPQVETLEGIISLSSVKVSDTVYQVVDSGFVYARPYSTYNLTVDQIASSNLTITVSDPDRGIVATDTIVQDTSLRVYALPHSEVNIVVNQDAKIAIVASSLSDDVEATATIRQWANIIIVAQPHSCVEVTTTQTAAARVAVVGGKTDIQQNVTTLATVRPNSTVKVNGADLNPTLPNGVASYDHSYQYPQN